MNKLILFQLKFATVIINLQSPTTANIQWETIIRDGSESSTTQRT